MWALQFCIQVPWMFSISILCWRPLQLYRHITFNHNTVTEKWYNVAFVRAAVVIIKSYLEHRMQRILGIVWYKPTSVTLLTPVNSLHWAIRNWVTTIEHLKKSCVRQVCSTGGGCRLATTDLEISCNNSKERKRKCNIPRVPRANKMSYFFMQ